jgi:leucyl-tRNA synthetase
VPAPHDAGEAQQVDHRVGLAVLHMPAPPHPAVRGEHREQSLLPRQVPHLAAEQLLADMKEIEGGWPERVLTMQRNWIGRSEGAFVDFRIKDSDAVVRVFTTRIDTIYGATAIVVAAEHPLLNELPEDSQLRADVARFVERVKASARNRTNASDDELEKEGVNTGLMAVNPFSGESIPVWVANYVLMEYGTGAVMSVPAANNPYASGCYGAFIWRKLASTL